MVNTVKVSSHIISKLFQDAPLGFPTQAGVTALGRCVLSCPVSARTQCGEAGVLALEGGRFKSVILEPRTVI